MDWQTRLKHYLWRFVTGFTAATLVIIIVFHVFLKQEINISDFVKIAICIAIFTFFGAPRYTRGRN
jgi:hypothetical protein